MFAHICSKNVHERKLKGHFVVDMDGKVINKDLVKQINWLTNTYQVAVETTVLLKQESLQPLSSFLRTECALGNIVRQELVSMIPAILLDVKSHHLV